MRLARTALLLAAACTSAAALDEPASVPSTLDIADVSTDQFESHPAFDPRTGDLFFVRSSPRFQACKIWRSRCTAFGRAAAEQRRSEGQR